jgi:hypothetical protein
MILLQCLSGNAFFGIVSWGTPRLKCFSGRVSAAMPSSGGSLRQHLFRNVSSAPFLLQMHFGGISLEDIWRSFHQLVDKRKRVGLGEGSEVVDKQPDLVGRRMRFLLLFVLHTC